MKGLILSFSLVLLSGCANNQPQAEYVPDPSIQQWKLSHLNAAAKKEAAQPVVMWERYNGDICHHLTAPNGIAWVSCHNPNTTCTKVCRQTNEWTGAVECHTVCL